MDSPTTTHRLIVLKELAGNPAPELGALQTLLYPHASTIMGGWILLWSLVAWYLITKLIGILYQAHMARKD